MGTLFGAIICTMTFIGLRSFSVDFKKDWDKLLLQTIVILMIYLVMDSILFIF